MHSTSDYLQVVEIERATGKSLHFREQDELVEVEDDEESITVLLRRVKVRDYTYRIYYESAKLHLVRFCRNEDGEWELDSEMEIPDPDFKPYVCHKTGRIETVEDSYERWEQEKICYRPGNKTRLGGRDSYKRECQRGEWGY